MVQLNLVAEPFDEFDHDAVGPAEALLDDVLAAASVAAQIFRVIFLEYVIGFNPAVIDRIDEPLRYVKGDVMSVNAPKVVDNPRMIWRPYVRKIPLLTGSHVRRRHSACMIHEKRLVPGKDDVWIDGRLDAKKQRRQIAYVQIVTVQTFGVDVVVAPS